MIRFLTIYTGTGFFARNDTRMNEHDWVPTGRLAMRLFCLVLLLAAGMLFPLSGRADSLLPGGAYPPPNCTSPLQPLPGDSPREWHIYRSSMAQYRQCVERYLNTARQDIARIQQQMDKAVREYNDASGN